MEKILFVGMPGCGKSTLGKKVAKLLKYEFIDLDLYIEKKENCCIKDIFTYQGEEYFRKIETKYLAEILSSGKSFVLSVGGGTPCFNDNMALMKKNGRCIYIQAGARLLLNRLENAKSQRPLFWGLTKEEIEKKLQQLLDARSKYYEMATHTIDASNVNEKEVVNLIKGQSS